MQTEELNKVIDKISKLVAEQCIEIIMCGDAMYYDPSDLSEYNEGWVRGRLLAIEHIKQEFDL